MRVQGKLPIHHERRHEDDVRAAVGRQPAGEVERVLGLVSVEQGNDDAAIGDRLRAEGEPPRTAADQADVREPHRSNW